VLDGPQPGFDDRGKVIDVEDGQVAQAVFQHGPGAFNRLSIVRGALASQAWARRLSAGRACFGWWSGPGGCGAATGVKVGRRGRWGDGHPP
jgi:hypothetical protein